MRSRWYTPSAVVLLTAAVSVLLSQIPLAQGQNVGSDFAEKADGFCLQDLQQERVCRPPAFVPPELIAPLAASPPPPAPSQNSKFDVAVVIQRHGSRRSMLGDARSTPFYGKTHPGQLLPQGAYELHVAGIEMRRYMMNALGMSSGRTGRHRSPSASPETVYKTTLGLDLTEECRAARVNPSLCTLPNLVLSLGGQIPPEAVYARSSALPRTQWSGLMFLEGFYGLPFGCAGTVEELNKTRGGRTKDVCLRRTVCDNSREKMDWIDTFRENCTSQRLPCVHAPSTDDDGLMCGATVSKQAYADATAHYESRGVNRTYEARDPRIREALGIAADVFAEEVLGTGLSWMAGEMAFSERAAGAAIPLAKLATWVEEQKQRCDNPQALCDPEQVRSYESLVEDLLNAFREGSNVQYADGQFSRYVASPAVGLQNALFRVKAFGRDEDLDHLQKMLHMLGGFEGLKQEAAVDKLKMLLISFHDFLLLALMELLDIQHNEVLPFASRLTFELSHVDAETMPQGSHIRGGKSGPERAPTCQFCADEGEGNSTPGNQGLWPKSSHVVRVLMGQPGGALQPLELPWCDSAVACPLSRWLDYTYGRVEDHWFYNVASHFHQKYVEAHDGAAGGASWI